MTSVGLRVLSAGPGVTIQDGGRHGFLRFGVSESGPVDPLAHKTANLAVGVPYDSATIEVSVGGVELTSEGAALTVAVAGGSFSVSLDDQALPAASLVRVGVSQKLTVRAGASGAWCYIAVAGRFNLQPALGSLSMHTRSFIGGTALKAGAYLPVIDSQTTELAIGEIVSPWLDRDGKIIRVILGPQDDYFDSSQLKAFLDGPWTVSNRSDRMAYLLEGPKLVHAKGFNIVSDGTAAGSIQIPGEGSPIVLMADRPPTGGYPKIATVIGADRGRLAQLRPGQKFRFKTISIQDAISARRDEMEALAKPILLRLLAHSFPSEFLLSHNLVDGVADGLAEPFGTPAKSPKRHPQ
jgi:biotin-dependent carboxylase-like uncharacterized protein